MTSTRNDSFDDDGNVADCWLIVHFPDHSPEFEFQIANKNDLDYDSWTLLERNAQVAVRTKFGHAKMPCYVVKVSDDREDIKANFTEYVEDYKNINSDRFHIWQCDNNRFSHCCVKKIADKETQTSNDEEMGSLEYKRLKRRFEELESENESLRKETENYRAAIHTLNLSVGYPGIVKTENKPPQSIQNTRLQHQPLKENISTDNKENSSETVQIGSNGTKIPRNVYDSLNWGNPSMATRKLLSTLFTREVLATHSLSGKPSPAFINSSKKTKKRLEPKIITDIIEIVKRKTGLPESAVKGLITTKCADENKMHKKELEKCPSNKGNNESQKKMKLV